MYLVDTSVWIDFLKKKEERLLPYLEGREVYVTEIVLFELLSGLPPFKQPSLSRYLSLFRRFNLTEEISIEAARIAAEMRSKKKNPQTTDMLIAATALFHEATLIHRDKDFEVIKEFCPLKTIPF